MVHLCEPRASPSQAAALFHQLPGDLTYVNIPSTPDPHIDDIIISAGRHNVGLSPLWSMASLAAFCLDETVTLPLTGAARRSSAASRLNRSQASIIRHQASISQKKNPVTAPIRVAHFCLESFTNDHHKYAHAYPMWLWSAPSWGVRVTTCPVSDTLIREPQCHKNSMEKGESSTYEGACELISF